MSRTLVLAVLLAAGCSKPTPTTEAPAPAPKKPQPKPEPVPQPVAEPEPIGPEIAPYPRVAVRRPEHALPEGVEYLLKQQSPDGAWRSDVYATFRDGLALTPHVVVTLQEAAAVGIDSKASQEARAKGSAFLAKRVDVEGTVNEGEDGIDYPVYTASLAIIALSHPENKAYTRARDGWVQFLLNRQLTDALGWTADDKQFGGWGYCRVVPKKPEPNKIAPPLIESNLSATLYALEALKAAGVTDKARHDAALFFVRRCQNWSIVPDTPDPGEEHRDGGFHFIYDDPVRNKAGEYTATEGRPGRFNSYGSATADGARVLALCGKKEGPYIDDARTWLKRNFNATRHPGAYTKAMEPNRNAVYFYYAMSVSKALRDGGIADVNGKSWAYDLGYELTRRQRRDGSWANPLDLVRENDPLVATCYAVSALATCKATGKQ